MTTVKQRGIVQEVQEDKYSVALPASTVTVTAEHIARSTKITKDLMRRLLSAVAGRTRAGGTQMWAVEATIAKRLGLDAPYRPDSESVLPPETPARVQQKQAPAGRGKRPVDVAAETDADGAAAGAAPAAGPRWLVTPPAAAAREARASRAAQYPIEDVR